MARALPFYFHDAMAKLGRMMNRAACIAIWLGKRIAVFPLVLALGAAPAAAAESGEAHYGRCLALIARNPAIALGEATSWARAGGGPAAEHCAALALVALGRNGEAAQRLDSLARAPQTPGALRAEIYGQAGNAWILAGDGRRAVASLQAALTLAGNDPELFADLGRAQAMVKNWNEAVLDLNAALAQNPRRADLLLLRASAQRALRRYVEALKDLNSALAITPGSAEVLMERGLLRRDAGDLGGARGDLLAAQKNGSAAVKREASAALDTIRQ
jgi:tetratricopeptide (TPR) repeat protein